MSARHDNQARPSQRDLLPRCDDPTAPPTGASVWKYRAIYVQGDQVFGQWSDPVSIAVQG